MPIRIKGGRQIKEIKSMTNLSLNFIAIKATDSEMTKFLLAGTGKKKATANNAEEALHEEKVYL